MPVTIDLPPEIEKELRFTAEQLSMSLDELVSKMITEIIGGDIASITTPHNAEVQTRINERRDENAEAIINEAVREMKENQVRNREVAVNVITFKNNCQAEVERAERVITQLENKAKTALQEGKENLAESFFHEMLIHERTLHNMRKNLLMATEAAEKVKASIRREEERIRRQTAEALAAKTVLKQAQLLVQIDEARDQVSFDLQEEIDSEVWRDFFRKWAADNRGEEVTRLLTENQFMAEVTSLQQHLDKLQSELLHYIASQGARSE